MSAGLPGLGLGGLFFIISALLAPAVEGVRTIRGQSEPGAWRAVWRQFAIAVTMVAAIYLTLQGVFGVTHIAGMGGQVDGSMVAVPVAALGVTGGLLVLVVGGAKLAQLLVGPPAGRSDGDTGSMRPVSRRRLGKPDRPRRGRPPVPRPAEANE